MQNLSIIMNHTHEYRLGAYRMVLKTPDIPQSERDDVALSILTAVTTYKHTKRLCEAICLSAETVTVPYCAIISHTHRESKAYCISQGMDVYLTQSIGEYMLTDQPIQLHGMNPDQILNMEDGVLAEIYEEGGCIFKDKAGQRLNRQYWEAMKGRHNAPRIPLLSTDDYSTLLAKANMDKRVPVSV